MTDKLILQDVGLRAIQNANAGGILVDPVFFRGGDSGLSPTIENATDILGNTLIQGSIHHVEVASANSARFFFVLDGNSVEVETEIKELCVYLTGEVLLGRCVFSEPIVLIPNELYEISVVMTSTRGDLTTINVAYGDYESLPMTAFLYRLPAPAATQFNGILVANGKVNSAGGDSPVLAMRSGAGAFQWGFTDHTRVYSAKPKTATTSSFTITSSQVFVDKEVVIVHVVAGTGQGQTRRFYYEAANGSFIESDGRNLTDLANCTIAVWRQTGGSQLGGGSGLPDKTNVPEDWVLISGPGEAPVWGPQKSGAKVLNTLYTAPGRLDINILNYIGNGQEARYSIGDLIVENANFVYPALGGVTQHRTAFDVNASEVEFAEKISAAVPIDLRIFTKASSTGTRLEFTSDHHTGDGQKVRFKMSQPIADVKFLFAFLAGTLQQMSAYTYDPQTNEIVFAEPPLAGLPLELRSFRQVLATGYSTRITTQTYMITGETLYLVLPFKPQTKEQVFLSHQGTHVHDDLYTIVEDTLILTGSLQDGVEVEVLIFDNVEAQGTENTNLKGVVYDGFLSYKSLKLLRHGMSPITLPIPAPNFEAGDGIRLTGQYPTLRIENTYAAAAQDDPITVHTNLITEKNANQVLATHRVEVENNMLIQVSCDFSVRLGPGFMSTQGLENIEFVVGMRSTNTKEPDYGKQIIGTGQAGFSSITGTENAAAMAYANASMTRIFEIEKDNHPAGFVEVVGKMRINNANVSQFPALLTLNISVTKIPKWDS
jgi:hypothetical protein